MKWISGVPLTFLCLSLTGFVGCKRQRPPEKILLSGNIEVIKVDASFRVGGRVVERPVNEGDRVEKGQVLAKLESEDLLQQLLARKAEFASADAALAVLLAGSRPEEIQASQAAYEQAKADLTRLETDIVRAKGLHQSGVLSTRDFEATLAAFEAAKAKVNQTQQQALLVKKGPRPEEIRQGKARVEQARQAVALAQTQLGYATLRSPITGTVLSKNVEPMEVVPAGVSVVSLADVSNVFLRAYLEEPDLPKVKLGQKAFIRVDGHPQPLDGRVSFIAQDAEFTPKTIQTRKERVKLVFRIKIDIPNPALILKPGVPAEAEIL